jgi:CheY-like chemotaxis protein
MDSPGLSSATFVRGDGRPRAVPTGLLMRILLVEDHADSLEALSRLLRMRGYDVAGVRTGSDALAACETEPFDLMVADIGLPDIDGWDLVSRVRNRCGLRAIAISGYCRDSDVARSLRAGFEAHLPKPIDLPTLLRAIEGVMA